MLQKGWRLSPCCQAIEHRRATSTYFSQSSKTESTANLRQIFKKGLIYLRKFFDTIIFGKDEMIGVNEWRFLCMMAQAMGMNH